MYDLKHIVCQYSNDVEMNLQRLKVQNHCVLLLSIPGEQIYLNGDVHIYN